MTGVAQWSDYQMPESDRLTLAFAQAAALHGAVLANYVEATEALVRNGRVAGIRAVDRLSGEALELEARLTVNAAGAACRPWMERFGARPAFPLLKAMNLVTSRPAGPVALGAPTSGGRLLLIMPWHGRMLVGTSHSDQPAEPDDARVCRDELRAFVAEVNSAFPALELSAREVTLVHRGVVPAVRNRHGVLGLMGHHRIHDHARDGMAGAVSVAGVKYTTARGVAEQVVNLVGRKLGLSTPPCRTGTVRLPHWDFSDVAGEANRARAGAAPALDPDCAAMLVTTHGTAWKAVVARCEQDPALASRLVPDLPFAAAAVTARDRGRNGLHAHRCRRPASADWRCRLSRRRCGGRLRSGHGSCPGLGRGAAGGGGRGRARRLPGLVAAQKAFWLSMRIVTGPSLTSSTCMCAR